MSRRRAELWMLGLLPLLVVRLLLPTGVMPARGTHGLALVLCSAQHARSAPDTGHVHADALCPFAAAGTPAPPASPMPPAVAPSPSSLWPLARQARCSGPSGAPRSQLARAPPVILLKS
jgi:hypothetical protein